MKFKLNESFDNTSDLLNIYKKFYKEPVDIKVIDDKSVYFKLENGFTFYYSIEGMTLRIKGPLSFKSYCEVGNPLAEQLCMLLQNRLPFELALYTYFKSQS